MKDQQLQAAKRKAGTPGSGPSIGGGGGRAARPKAQRSARPINALEVMKSHGLLTKHDRDGTRFCFAFNLPEGCTAASPGQACPKGAHICARPGCQDKKHPHSAQSPH